MAENPRTERKRSRGDEARDAQPPQWKQQQKRGPVAGEKGPGKGPTQVNGRGPKYTFVITNVENDLTVIHEEAVQRFLGLDDTKNLDQKKSFRSQREMGGAPGGGSNPADASVSQHGKCRYTVTARSETHSAEIAIYGPPHASVESVFLPVSLPAEPRLSGSQGTAAGASGTSKGKRPKGEEALTAAEASPATGGAVVGKSGAPRYSTLGDMAAILKSKPYFLFPPSLFLNLPEDDSAALSEEERRALGLRWSLAAEQARESGEGSKKKARKASGADATEDEVAGRHRQPVYLTVFRQADAISVKAATSQRVSTKDLKRMLQDVVPGFVSCWWIHDQQFRVVFEAKEPLFKAKQLLDQFTTDSQVRVTLQFPEGLRREYEEFVAGTVEEEAAV